MSQPNVCVITSPGGNCDDDTFNAFERFGADAEKIHISQLDSGERTLNGFQILALPGGFSYGDTIASGRILGIEVQTRLGDQLNDFHDNGGLSIGICNGDQVMTEIGLIPDGRVDPTKPKAITLAHNLSGKFESRWVHLKVEPSKCLFFQPEDIGEVIELPVAHGEGRYVAADSEAMFDRLQRNGQIVCRYAGEDGQPTTDYPANPNGSPYGIAGICDPSGRILGMMPHPERFINRTHHPNWQRGQGQIQYGALIIKQMIKVAKGM